MSFKQYFEWRLHVMSSPKLLVRSCSVVVAHSLPAGFDSVRAWVHSLHCLLALALISLVVVAHSVPGGLNLFDCSLELASQVCRVLRFSQAWSFALVTSCTCTSWCMQLAGSLPQCRLVSILDRADWSCDSNSVRQIKPFCLMPSEAPRRKSLVYKEKHSSENNFSFYFLFTQEHTTCFKTDYIFDH